VPKGNKTTLFISSTCYDLSQIRANLRDFAESMGFDPVLSEFDTFPVNPSQNTLNNCLEAVKNRADIFLLIVGGRYGSLTETGKSITNLEFSEACVKGIPKFIFVQNEILTLLPIWKNNPEADFSSAVDTPRLFKFISELRDSGEIWVYPFSSSQDIIGTLRKQLSYLFSECLELRNIFHKSELDLTQLDSKALRLVIEKPLGWEYLLFAQILSDQVNSYSSKRLDAELGISFGEPITLDEVSEIIDWIRSRFSWISNTIMQLSKALNTGFMKAVGEPGEPGDIQRIIHLAKRIGDAYEQLLEWKIQFFRLKVNEDFERLTYLVSEFSSNAIKEIEEFTLNLYCTLEGYIRESHTYDKGTVITLTLSLTLPDTEDFMCELERLKKLYL
jgi:hypothetical protein